MENTQQAEQNVNTNAGVEEPVEYASAMGRFLAAMIDLTIFGFAFGTIRALFGIKEYEAGFYTPLMNLLSWSYFIFFQVKYGATLGKMIMGFRVQDAATGKNMDWVQAILREIVGKTVSSLVFLLGFVAIIWDKNNQGWHDKIAKTVVVKLKK